MADIASISLEIRSNGLERGIKNLRGLQDQGANTERSISGVTKAVSALSAAAAAVGVANLSRSMYNAVASAQSLQASLKTVTGSTDAAGAAWDNLLKFATKTPFTLDQSVNAFIRMKSLGLDPTEAALTSFGNTASAMGKDLMQYVEAVADAVTGENERLKEFGIRASKQGDEIAYTFQGVTTVVKNNSEAIQGYLENIGNTAFAGAMEDQMATLNGQASNLEDSIYQLWLAIGDAGATDVFSGGMSDAAGAVQRLQAAVENGVFDWIFDAYNRINESGNDMIEDLVEIGQGAIMLSNEFERALLGIQSDFYALKASALEAMGGIALGSAQAINQGLIPVQKALNYLDETFANLIDNIGSFLGPLGGGLSEYAAKIRSDLIDPVGITTELFYDNANASRAMSESLSAQADMIGKAAIELNTLDGWLLKGEQSTKALSKATDASTSSSKAAAKAASDLAKRIEDQQKAVQSLFGEVNKSGKAWADYRDNLTSIEKKTSYLINPTLEMAAAIGVNAMQLNEALRAADPYAQELDKLAGKYSETSTKAQELSRDIQALSEGIEKTGDPTGELTRALGEAKKKMGELAVEADKTADLILQTIERMDGAFVDSWKNLLSGAENTFDSFKDMAISALAEVIHAYTTRQITAQLSAVINPGSGGLGGLGGGSGGGMDLMSIGKNVYNGITDGFGSINWMGASTGAQGYTSGFGSQVASGGGRFGGSLQNFSGFNGIASMGAGAAGSYVGGSLGSSLTGKTAGSGYGSMAGGAIGTYFGGPLGAFAGSAIGGALDSLFGSKKEKPFARTYTGAQDLDTNGFYRANQGDEYWSHTDLGTVGVLDKHGLDPEGLQEWVKGLEETDNAIAAMLDDTQLERAQSHVSHAYMYKGTDLEGVAENRYNAVLNGIIDGSDEFTGELLQRLGRIQSDTFEEQMDQLGQILQAGRLVESLDGSVQEYAKGVINANSDLQSALDEVTAGLSAHSSVSEMAELLSLKFDDLRAGAVEASISLVNIAGGLDQLQASTGQYYQTYFSEHERTQRVIGNVLPVLEQYNLSLGSSKDQFRAVVSALDLNSESGRKAYAELMGVSSAFADLTENASAAQKAVQTAAVNNYQSAFEALKKSVNAEREVLRESFDATSNRIGSNIDRINESMRDGERAVDALSGALSSMFGSQQQTMGGLGAARDYLSGVSAAGSVSDYDTLEKALGIVSEPSEGLYSSFADYQSDFYATAGVIGNIKDSAETQLTAQERSIAALERQLDQAESQYNMESDKFDQVLDKQAAFIESQIGQQTWLERINESVLTIPQALSGITQAKGAAANGTAFTGNLNNRFGQASDKYLADNPDVAAAVQNGTFKSAYDHYIQYGQYEDNRGGFPAFATGGNHTGGWRVVGEKGPELEWTAPSKIMNSGSTMNAINTEAVRQAVDQMRVEMGGYLRDIMLSNGEINLTLDDWDGTGLPQTRSVEEL